VENNLTMDMRIAIPMFILWIVISFIALILLFKDKGTKKTRIIIYIISFVLGGILLGGIPSAVMPIQQILRVIGVGSGLLLIIPMIIILTLLILTTLIFGRIFCGFACPVGALQELISKLKFKSNLKEQKYVKYKLDISTKTANIVRWCFFGLLILMSIIWSLTLLQFINPFLGFNYFKNPLSLVLLIPLIILIIVAMLSIFIYRPWCRFLCPFGALASLTSRFSRYKLRRTESCTECGLCEKICPTQEAFTNSSKSECYLCNRCVEICPENALKFIKNE